MTEMLTLRTDSTVGGDNVDVRVDLEVSSATSMRLPHRVPFFIPRNQVYYWSREWQESVRESLAAYEADDYVEFDSDDVDDVVRRFSDGGG